MAEFDLAAMLAGKVSKLDTGNREHIEYILLDNIIPHMGNFYQLSGIDELANNILLAGLQQPLRVRKLPEGGGKYTIISGHRRYTALKKLLEEGRTEFREVQCIVETSEEPAALTELKLILANSDTRKIIPADLDKQQVRMEDLLNELRELGYDFPGRTRDYVAKLCNTSASRLARLKVIREKLAVPLLREKYEKGKLNESIAYEIARQPEEFQKVCSIAVTNNRYFYQQGVGVLRSMCEAIDAIHCPETGEKCAHAGKMKSHTAKTDDYARKCRGCCVDCGYLADCKDSCSMAAAARDKILKKREADARKKEAERKKENQPYTDLAKLIYSRIRERLKSGGIDLNDYLSHINQTYSDNLRNRISAETEFDGDCYTLSGLGPNVREIREIIAAAKFLQCSVDYLLGLTASPVLAPQPAASCSWHTGNPTEPGEYPVRSTWYSAVHLDIMFWDGTCWKFDKEDGVGISPAASVLQWCDRPKEMSALNNSCESGLSPTGHCGSAAYCGENHSYCLECDDPCNSKCGWMEEE